MRHQTLEILDTILNTTEPLLKRANSLRDGVSAIRVTEDHITATVTSARHPDKSYEVSIHLAGRRRRCTCEAHQYYRDVPCKHTIAVAMVVKDVLTLVG